MGTQAFKVLAFLAVLAAGYLLVRDLLGRRVFGTDAERATHAALHEANLAAPPLRQGLTAEAARASAGHLRALLGSCAVALTDTGSLLAWEGEGDQHAAGATQLARETLGHGLTTVEKVSCTRPDCRVRRAVVVPLVVEDRVVGTLSAYAAEVGPGLVRATNEVGRWVSAQLELAELDTSRALLAEAQVRALRAQISPHFVYNALTAIASFVRTDPERARELLIEFADFTRYSSSTHGDFTTLAEELRSIDRYLLLERARFGDRLQVVLRVAPEVLPVPVPYLCLQPLVENAVQHGLEQGRGSVTVTVVATDEAYGCRITVEDDGAGSDPERIRAALGGTAGDSMGLANVDARLRAVYGGDHGLTVETAPGAGTKVTVRVPKWHPAAQAS